MAKRPSQSAPPPAKNKKSGAKRPVKKPSAKKAMTAVKTPVKNKTSVTKSATQQPQTLGELHSHIGSIAARLKRADTLTRKSVKALETAFTALDQRISETSTQSNHQLSIRINQLSRKLTNMIEQTQSTVNNDLRQALNNPNIDAIARAVARAENRLSAAETKQAAALSRINQHISDMALAVDQRITQETSKHEELIAQAETRFTARAESIENDCAQALSSIGDRVEVLANTLQTHVDQTAETMREQISEIALNTQTDFEQYRVNLQHRIEAVEDSKNSREATLTYQMETLASRIEGLEYNISQAAAPQPVAPSPYPDIPDAAPKPVPAAAMQSGSAQAIDSLPDAFAPVPAPHYGGNIAPNPYIQTPPPTEELTAQPDNQPAHFPQEYTPPTIDPMAQSPAYTPPAAMDAVAYDYETMTPSQTQIESVTPPPYPSQQSALGQNTPQAVPFDPAQHQIPNALDRDSIEIAHTRQPADDNLTPLPYENPAYAEDGTAATMDNARPGDFSHKEKAKRSASLPKITAQNKRVAALAAGVAVLSLVGLKVFSGGDDSAQLTPHLDTREAYQPESGTPPTPTLTPTIGQYADGRLDAATTPSVDRLAEKARTGDVVAEFQLGLSYLQQGRTDEGVALIRAAADKGQAAAQYRLAKLYEIGEGVEANAETARQLTERAARNGNRIAMHDLALYFAEGRGGVPKDMKLAAQWFEKAAERGVVDSQFNLGVLFESGQGLPQNLEDAYIWYSIAAGQGDQFAKKHIDNLATQLTEETKRRADSRIAGFVPTKIDNAANGIFSSPPTAQNGKPVAQIKHVQNLLSNLGYDAGGSDGAIGPKTRDAIMKFEHANSLPKTGRINSELVNRLELAAGV